MLLHKVILSHEVILLHNYLRRPWLTCMHSMRELVENWLCFIGMCRCIEYSK